MRASVFAVMILGIRMGSPRMSGCLVCGCLLSGSVSDLSTEMYLYCMRCTKYRSEAEFLQYNVKHSIRYCSNSNCDACRVPQLQICW